MLANQRASRECYQIQFPLFFVYHELSQELMEYSNCYFWLGVVIDFEQPEYSVNERNGTIEVCAVIVEGNLQRNITVTLTTRDGRAIGKVLMYSQTSALREYKNSL